MRRKDQDTLLIPSAPANFEAMIKWKGRSPKDQKRRADGNATAKHTSLAWRGAKWLAKSHERERKSLGASEEEPTLSLPNQKSVNSIQGTSLTQKKTRVPDRTLESQKNDVKGTGSREKGLRLLVPRHAIPRIPSARTGGRRLGNKGKGPSMLVTKKKETRKRPGPAGGKGKGGYPERISIALTKVKKAAWPEKHQKRGGTGTPKQRTGVDRKKEVDLKEWSPTGNRQAMSDLGRDAKNK